MTTPRRESGRYSPMACTLKEMGFCKRRVKKWSLSNKEK